jgi:hypothetical protein
MNASSSKGFSKHKELEKMFLFSLCNFHLNMLGPPAMCHQFSKMDYTPLALFFSKVFKFLYKG